MYIGSVELLSQVMWTYDSEQKRMVNREVKYVPGFFKIVDEILVNAADHKVRLSRPQRTRLTYIGNTGQR
jgi:DNA topoisomerase-2